MEQYFACMLVVDSNSPKVCCFRTAGIVVYPPPQSMSRGVAYWQPSKYLDAPKPPPPDARDRERRLSLQAMKGDEHDATYSDAPSTIGALCRYGCATALAVAWRATTRSCGPVRTRSLGYFRHLRMRSLRRLWPACLYIYRRTKCDALSTLCAGFRRHGVF